MRWAGALALAAAATACGAGDEEAVRVAAAASLAPAMEELADAFTAATGTEVEATFAGTPTLVAQIAEGSPVDVFLAADRINMARVKDLGVAPPARFAGNALSLAVPQGNPLGLGGLADLVEDRLVIAIGAEGVPIGRYTRQALSSAGVTVSPATFEPSVAALVSKVELGEVDAAVVYVTDVIEAADRIDGVPLETAVAIDYLALPLSPGAAEQFVSLLTGPDGQAILATHGFAP